MADIGGLEWHRSPYCDTGACVEVAFAGDHVYMRNAAEPDVHLVFTREEWRTFVRALVDQAL
jgi:hypothetical protein